jgi:hypothetical protein
LKRFQLDYEPEMLLKSHALGFKEAEKRIDLSWEVENLKVPRLK